MSDLVAERGVTAFTAAALELGWIVRRQHESDQGIDAQIEQVDEREAATGRLIAVQIKGGASWFNRPTKSDGWWFSFSERERNLWLNHALPVIVAMYHPGHREVYWQRISATTISKARTRYRVEVPRGQTVATAGPAWVSMASGAEQRAEHRFDFSLLSLPPAVAKIISSRDEQERASAALLAMHLAEGKLNPRGTAAALLASKPVWISGNASWAWIAVGQYCSEHGLLELAADAYELAARALQGAKQTRALVAAATHRVFSNREAAQRLIAAADDNGQEPVLRAVGRTAVRGEDENGRWALDPVLEAGGPDVDGDASAQRLLCAVARARGQLDEALAHAEAALDLNADSSETMALAASCHLAHWSTKGGADTGLTRAIELLRKVVAQRKAWAGPLSDVRHDLASSLAMAGEFEAVLSMALPPPGGVAEPSDVDPKVLSVAAIAAMQIDNDDALSQVVGLLGDTPEDRLALARAGALTLPHDELVSLRMASFESAIDAKNFSDIAQHGFALSKDGIDITERLRPHVDRGNLPESMLGLCKALLSVHAEGLDAALPALRELAKTDTIAAELLLDQLNRAQRFNEVAAQARQLFEITQAGSYAAHEARALFSAGDIDRAVVVGTQAIARNDIRPHERVDLLNLLGGVFGEREDWGLAERYFGQAIELLDRPGPGLVWNFVACLAAQGRIAKAAQTVAKFRPEVRDLRDAHLWLRANAATVWNESTAFDAFALAQRFDDPKLSTALATAIVTRTYGVGDPDADAADELESRRRAAQGAVPGDLHRQAFDFIQQLVDRYGSETGLTVLSGTEDQLLDQVIGQLKDVSKADGRKRDLVKMAREGRLPVGLIASAFHRGHATMEAQRVFGFRLASSADDDEHGIEVAAATAALNRTVVIDASTVLTLTGVPDADSLTGHFVGLAVPPTAMLDLHRLGDDIRGMAGSPGSMRWDEELGQPVFAELSDEEFMRLLRRAEAVERYVDQLVVRSPGPSTVFTELDGSPLEGPWIDVIRLCANDEAYLWSDDLGMRRAARSVNIDAFGTPALVDALRDAQIAAANSADSMEPAILQASARNLQLARDHVVDLVLGANDVPVLAEEEDWRPGAAAAAIARRSFWMWNPRAFEVLRTIYSHAKVSAPETLTQWQVFAMHGAASDHVQPGAGSAVLAVLALVGFGDRPSDPERAEGMLRARRIARDLDLPDPASGLPHAAQLLAKAGECDDPDGLVKRVLGLISDNEDDLVPSA